MGVGAGMGDEGGGQGRVNVFCPGGMAMINLSRSGRGTRFPGERPWLVRGGAESGADGPAEGCQATLRHK